MQSLCSLPTEVLLAILTRAPLFDRCALALTCKFFAETLGAGGLLRYRSPTHDDILYYQQRYSCRKWGARAAVQSPQVKYPRCDPFPELAVPPRWFRKTFCQSCRHCQSRFVPKWPYIDCAWGSSGSSSERGMDGTDVLARRAATGRGCRLHPHMPHSSDKAQAESSEGV